MRAIALMPTCNTTVHRLVAVTAALIFTLGVFSLLNLQSPKALSRRPLQHSSENTGEGVTESYIDHGEGPGSNQPWWFIGTMTAAHNIQRRQIIRATWQSLYRDDSTFTMRFVISNPTELWRRVIKHENDTFGDIIELSQLEEGWKVANSVKTMHMFKHLEKQGRRYEWVTKIDDDSFLDVPAFLHNYLLPRMDTKSWPPVTNVNRTIIGRKLYMGPVLFPGGQFYTMTWNTMTKVSELYDRTPFDNLGEDELNGRLLHDAKVPWDLINLENPIAFDYDDSKARGDGSAWVAENDEYQLKEWIHAVGPGSINPHKMKQDDSYLRVAACYDRRGLIDRPPMGEKITVNW